MTDISIFLKNLVNNLEESCLSKNNNTHIQWNISDLDLDIKKCRDHCYIDTGYLYNSVKLCDLCNKILHENLDKFSKNQNELIYDNFMLQRKISDLDKRIEKLDDVITKMSDKFNKLTSDYNNLQLKIKNINSESQMIKNIVDANLIENNYNINRLNNMINNIDNNIDNNKNNNIIIDNNKNNNNIIENKIYYDNNCYYDNDYRNNIINNYYNNKNSDNNKHANIKILDKCKVGGIGIILSVCTISKGYVKPQYVYRCKNKDIIFQIKTFENNFCPIEFIHPSNLISFTVNMILGNTTDIDIGDECVFVSNK